MGKYSVNFLAAANHLGSLEKFKKWYEKATNKKFQENYKAEDAFKQCKADLEAWNKRKAK